MPNFPSLPSPSEEFRDLRKLYDRLLLSVFPISGYALDRTHDPILTCSFHCARGLQRHVGFGACPFVIKAERASLKTPWTVISPLEYDHDHEPIPLSRPRRGTALAEALEKFGVGDEFWVNGDNGGKDDEDGEKEEKPMGSDEEEDDEQLEQADFGSTPPVQEQPLSPDGLRYQKRQKLKLNGRAQVRSSSGLEVIDLTGEDDNEEDEDYEAGSEANEAEGSVDGAEQEQNFVGRDDSGVFVGSDVEEDVKSINEAEEEEEEAGRDGSEEAAPSQYSQFKQYLDTLDPEFRLGWCVDTLWDRPFLIRSERQLLMVARKDLKGLMELFTKETAFGPACALRQGLEDALDRE